MADAVRTWDRYPVHGGDWLPIGVVRQGCGCVLDTWNKRMWRPCMAHQADGHLAVISEQDSMIVARCLVAACRWRVDEFYEATAVRAAEQHWTDTAGHAAENTADDN